MVNKDVVDQMIIDAKGATDNQQSLSKEELFICNSDSADTEKPIMCAKNADELEELIRKLRKSLATLQEVPSALRAIIDIDEKSGDGLTQDPAEMEGRKDTCRCRCKHAHGNSEEYCENPPARLGNFNHDVTLYTTHRAFKIYEKALERSRCKRIGDGSFFTAKRKWDRLVRDFPISEASKLRLIPLAFDGDAERVFDDVSGENIGCTSDELWEHLQTRLCNDTHQSVLRDNFFAMQWNESRESFMKFATRLRSAAMMLPSGTIDEGFLLNRLKTGLPKRIQDQAALISGSYDEVVGKLASLSTVKNPKERVRAVVEGSHIEPKTNTPTQPWWETAQCHYCKEVGHIARHCPKKRRDKEMSKNLQGKGEAPKKPLEEPKN